MTLKADIRLLLPVLLTIEVNARALTIELLYRAISSVRRAMRSNYPCNHLHYPRRSSARKVGLNTQKALMLEYGYAPHFPMDFGAACSNCPIGRRGDDGRTMRAIIQARLVKF
ncbi:MAG TPA: hypothetical protein VF485_03550 [Sphingomonas sp.]